MEAIYVIGDVHGCIKSLKKLVAKLPKNSKVCFVGDLIDRGKNSKKVVDFIIKGKYDCVLGNHELFFIKALPKILNNESDPEVDYWLNKCGGLATLESYKSNGDLDKEKLLEHFNYLKSLPPFIEYKNIKKDDRYLVVSHSHVYDKWVYKDYPKTSNEYQSLIETVLLKRYKSHDNKDIYNVYGHTIFEKPKINEYKAGIDLGCVKKEQKGKLCALEFPSLKTIIQENIEK